VLGVQEGARARVKCPAILACTKRKEGHAGRAIDENHVYSYALSTR
jgi:hypothetical protein